MKALKTLLLVLTVTLLGACGKKSNGSKANINRDRGNQAKLTCTNVKEENKTLQCQMLADLIAANEADGCKSVWEAAYNKNECTTGDGISDEIDADASETRVIGEQTDVGPEITAEVIDQGSNQITVEDGASASGVAYSAKPLRTYTVGTTTTSKPQVSTAGSAGLQRLVVTRQQNANTNTATAQTNNTVTSTATTTRREVVQLKPVTIQNRQTQTQTQTQAEPVAAAPATGSQISVSGSELQQLEREEPGRFMIQRTVRTTDPQSGEVIAETSVEKITEESAPQNAEFRISVPSIRYEADVQTVEQEQASQSTIGTATTEAQSEVVQENIQSATVQQSSPMVQDFTGADNGECRKVESVNETAVTVQGSLAITNYLNNLNQWSADICAKIGRSAKLKRSILDQLGGRDISRANCERELQAVTLSCSKKVANGNAVSDVFNSK